MPVASVAVGQDHTLALTETGEVYSWGMNHFSQLGYVIEVAIGTLSRHDEPIQSVPKRVVGALRKEIVQGVAASKKASACWTSDAVYTWGTNNGQLGTGILLVISYHLSTIRLRQKRTACPATSSSSHEIYQRCH